MSLIILLVSSHAPLLGLIQSEASDFKDLGKMLIGGFVLAVVAGVAFTLVRLRLRDKKPMGAQIISINTSTVKPK
jgi:hypothetical protein